MADISKIKLPNGTTYNIKDDNALPLTGGSVTGPVSFGDSVSIDEATVGDLVVNGSASFTNNLQANTINGVEVGNNPKFTDTITTATTAGSGNAVTAVTASNGALTITKGTTFLTSHQDISGKADKATTLAGYGITDAKIASGVITLGSNTITPLTSHQDISGKADKSATVSNVAYDSTNKKITKTINGTTSDVVTVATLKTALGSMPASDVYSWAKASTKPSYAYSEITGTVPSSALPSYVDDVLEYSAKSSFPTTGETGKIYVDTSTNLTWRWGGSAYVEISPSLALGTTSSTAYRGDYGNTAYTHATDANRLTTAKTSGLYKIATTAHGHVQSVTAVAKADITALGIPAQDTTYESKTAASGGTAVSLVTTGEKYTWNNKIGATTPTIATDTGTSTITLASAGKYKLTAGGGSVIFTMPTIPTVSYPVTSVNSKTGAVSLTAADVGALASNTTYVSKITTTAGAHTAISNKSGAVSFNVPTKTSHLTNDSGFLTSHQTLYEANLNWGGKDFSASYGPIDAAMIGELGANRFAFLKAAGITIEYSTDGGTTWTDYGATDIQKTGLFGRGQNFHLGKHSTNGSSTLNDMLRVTIATSAAGIYTVLNKIAIYMSTSGNTVQVLIERALESAPTSYVTHKDWTGISGWSGWNILNISGLTTYGNAASSQYGRVRFTFKQTAITTTYSAASITRIMGFGGVGWTTPSNMAYDGHLYSYDSAQNATFPAKVTATSFSGNLTGNVTGNVSGTASNVTGTVAIANGGTGQTTAANAINALLNGLPTWTADPTDSTYFIRQDTGGSATYGKVKASTIWNYISGKLPTIPTATDSATTGITASTTATKTTLGTASSIYGVKSGTNSTTTASKASGSNGSASTWAFEEVSIPNVTAAGSASTWAFEEVSIPNVTAAGSASTWAFEEVSIPNVTSAGSASTWAFTEVTVANSISGAVDANDSTQLNITLGFTPVQSKTSGGNGTAPTLGTAIKVQSKKSGANGTAPTLGTAIKVQSKKSGANGSAPTLGTAIKVQSKKSGSNGTAPSWSFTDVTVPIRSDSATSVPNVSVASATVSVTDPGHTHSI